MQDRFKFRVWHKKRKKMYDVLHFHTETWDNGGEWVTAKGFNIITQQDVHIQIDSKDGVIMQCTGLKDKNGKLIYEGDIVRNITGTYTFTGVIKFGKYTVSNSINQGFYVEWSKKYEDLFRNDLLYWLEKVEGLRIIGNIYENGDLLNE